jgi:hypothetical protein
MDGLRSGQQVLTEFVTQIHVDFIEAALAVTESVEVLIDMLQLAVLLFGLHFEVGKEVALHLVSVKEVIPLIDYGLIATAAEGFSLLTHTVVVVSFTLILRLGINVNAEGFMTHDLHGRFVTIAWVVVQIEGQLFSAFDFPCAKGHGLTDVTHTCIFIIVDNSRWSVSPRVQRNSMMRC